MTVPSSGIGGCFRVPTLAAHAGGSSYARTPSHRSRNTARVRGALGNVRALADRPTSAPTRRNPRPSTLRRSRSANAALDAAEQSAQKALAKKTPNLPKVPEGGPVESPTWVPCGDPNRPPAVGVPHHRHARRAKPARQVSAAHARRAPPARAARPQRHDGRESTTPQRSGANQRTKPPRGSARAPTRMVGTDEVHRRTCVCGRDRRAGVLPALGDGVRTPLDQRRQTRSTRQRRAGARAKYAGPRSPAHVPSQCPAVVSCIAASEGRRRSELQRWLLGWRRWWRRLVTRRCRRKCCASCDRQRRSRRTGVIERHVVTRRRFRALNTDVEILIDARPNPAVERLCDLAQSEFSRYEQTFSRFREDSELSRLNRSGCVYPSPERRGHPTGVGRTRPNRRQVRPNGPRRACRRRVRNHVRRHRRGSTALAARCGGGVAIDVVTGEIALEHEVRIELGGIAKGFTADGRTCW